MVFQSCLLGLAILYVNFQKLGIVSKLNEDSFDYVCYRLPVVVLVHEFTENVCVIRQWKVVYMLS